MKVSQETCRLAKEKGYTACGCGIGYPDCVCKGECWFIEQWELQKWLRDIHKLHISISSPYYDIKWMGSVFQIDYYSASKNIDEFNSYEEAMENGLIQALNLIK